MIRAQSRVRVVGVRRPCGVLSSTCGTTDASKNHTGKRMGTSHRVPVSTRGDAPYPGALPRTIDNGFVLISESHAKQLCGGTLPREGYERLVTLQEDIDGIWAGRKVWVARTRYEGRTYWSVREAPMSFGSRASTVMRRGDHTGLRNFLPGDRVRLTGPDFYSGMMAGATGTVQTIATGRGHSVYPDPLKSLVYVVWDSGAKVSVPRKLLERIPGVGRKGAEAPGLKDHRQKRESAWPHYRLGGGDYVVQLTPEAALAYDRFAYNVKPGVGIGWKPYTFRVTLNGMSSWAGHTQEEFQEYLDRSGLEAERWSPWEDGVRSSRLVRRKGQKPSSVERRSTAQGRGHVRSLRRKVEDMVGSLIASDTFLRAYLETALWSSTDEHEDPYDDRYSVYDIDAESVRAAKEDCDKFRAAAGNLLDGADDESAGHNFWLTRNRHGAGFWDTPEEWGGEVNATALTDLAHSFGEIDVIDYADEGGDGKRIQIARIAGVVRPGSMGRWWRSTPVSSPRRGGVEATPADTDPRVSRLVEAVKECAGDLAHYVSVHGPGPDRRYDELVAAVHAIDPQWAAPRRTRWRSPA